MAWRIGVDIGGTFTDVVLVAEETGRIGVTKKGDRRDPSGPVAISCGAGLGCAIGACDDDNWNIPPVTWSI
jgi:hypothetical protein